MTDDRLEHLRDVGRLLWPEPLELRVERTAAGGRPVHREYLLLPSSRAPRLLVPTGRRAAAGAVRRYGVGRGRGARWQAAVLAAGMVTGLAPLALRDRVRVVATGPGDQPAGSIESHLADVLGTEVEISMHLGAPRANRKPVLQVLAPDGRTLAFVKVGVDALTNRLVRAEAAALTWLATTELQQLTVPRVLHAGEWNGASLLVQSSLAVDGRRRRPSWERVAAAQRELAAVAGSGTAPLGASPYWAALTGRVAALPPGAAADALASVVDRARDVFADVDLRLGAWHGDWTPWNSALAGDDLLVWDWERFSPAVPIGYDALHWGLQTDLVNRLADPGASVLRCLTTAPDRLAGFGLDARGARATAVGYLADLAARYLADRQAEAGARLGDVGVWLIPPIDRALADV